jgi:plasmid stabilization system protein ParE
VKISLTDSAIDDLRELQIYYHEQLVPQVGKRFVTEIFDRIETLTNNPDIGRVVPEFDADNIRELIHKPLRVVYLRESTSIFVIRVWRSERILELP